MKNIKTIVFCTALLLLWTKPTQAQTPATSSTDGDTSLGTYVFVPEAPRYDEIQRLVSDKESEYYYPTLRQRFLSGDTTMTFQEFWTKKNGQKKPQLLLDVKWF